MSVTGATLTIPSDYPWVLASIAALSAQLFITNLVYVGGLRKKFFPKDKLQKEFGEEHKKAFGTEIARGGYPDTGSGRYSANLSYKDWYTFNVAQRIHYNFLEFFSPYVVLALIAGLHKPCISTFATVGIIVSRTLFHIGYVRGGAANPIRVAGALGSDIGFLVNLVAAACGICAWLKLC